MTWTPGRVPSVNRRSPISPAAAGRMEPFRFISSTRTDTTSSCARQYPSRAGSACRISLTQPRRPGGPALRPLGQRCADDLLVVADKDAFVREGGMAPDDRAAKTVAGRVQQMGAADLFIGFGAELRDDEVSGFAENEVAIAVLHQERRARAKGPLASGRRFESFPQPVAGG